MVFTYVILRLQDHLPFHGIIDGLANKTPITPDLAFNTAASFTTNTNWQSLLRREHDELFLADGRSLASHNFWSAALGIAVAAALVRGIARHESGTVGNFWVDLVRLHYYLLLPICLIYAVCSRFAGHPAELQALRHRAAHREADDPGAQDRREQPTRSRTPPATSCLQDQAVETQSIVEGPIASQMAIKMLGTNGGGFVNANAAHPFENPTPLSNFLQMLSIFAIPSALTYYLGRAVKNQKHGWAVWGAMAAIFLVGVGHLLEGGSGRQPKPVPQRRRADGRQHGRQGSALRHLQLRAVRHGHHGRFLRRGQRHARQLHAGRWVGAALFNIQLGEIVFGGVGAGLYGMLIFVLLAVFIAGLMVGRTPEYLGKKIQAFEVKMSRPGRARAHPVHPRFLGLGGGRK